MLALVLSGGGNFGAMQAGALEVVLKTGLRPEMVIGTSAGALNAIELAADPSPEGFLRVEGFWAQVGRDQVGSLSLLGGLRQLVTNKESLFSNDKLVAFMKEHLPADAPTFGELRKRNGLRAYTVSVCLDEGRPVVFGDREDDKVLDGAMASAGLPPYFPPWEVDGKRYVDGAVYSNLPIKMAVERGASQVIAIEINHAMQTVEVARDMIAISTTAVSLMVEFAGKAEVRWARRHGIPFRLISLKPPEDILFWDFDQPERLVEEGRRAMTAELDREPIHVLPAWRASLSRAAASVVRPRD